MWFGFQKATATPPKPAPKRVRSGAGASTGAPAGMNAAQGGTGDEDEQFISRQPQLDTEDKYDSRLSSDPDESTSSVKWWSIGSLGEQATHDLDNLGPNQ